jgi:hypothetical protein
LSFTRNVKARYEALPDDLQTQVGAKDNSCFGTCCKTGQPENREEKGAKRTLKQYPAA